MANLRDLPTRVAAMQVLLTKKGLLPNSKPITGFWDTEISDAWDHFCVRSPGMLGCASSNRGFNLTAINPTVLDELHDILNEGIKFEIPKSKKSVEKEINEDIDEKPKKIENNEIDSIPEIDNKTKKVVKISGDK